MNGVARSVGGQAVWQQKQQQQRACHGQLKRVCYNCEEQQQQKSEGDQSSFLWRGSRSHLTCAAFTPAQRTRLFASSPLQADSLGPHGEDSHRHSPLSRRLVMLGAPSWARDSIITRRVHRMSRP
ncbi:uncharacterized protein [Physcomitrium patens]|uniref:uncharacterized protein n=1 Tax=Physcomitrium patens TaxID=3218 RepID=UPI003CCD8DD8